MEYIIAFCIYSYLGATFEHLSYYFGKGPKKELANPIITGFPLYGIGAFLVVGLNEMLKRMGHDDNILIQFAVFATGLSVLEYIVGVYVGAGKNSYRNGMVKSWDYSDEFMNIDGKISLKHFIYWGIIGLIVIKIHYKLMTRIRCAVHCD